MMITRIANNGQKKFDIYIDETFVFSLYKGEIRRFSLEENKEISEEVVAEITKTVIVKRAKKRVLYLLEKSWKCEAEIRDKMKLSKYHEDVIEEAVLYAKSFGYIDDLEYARRFITSKRGGKSQKEISYLLSQKGVDRGIIELAFEEMYDEESDLEAIYSVVRKKKIDLTTATVEEKSKLCQYLLRKGFEYGKIRKVLQVYE